MTHPFSRASLGLPRPPASSCGTKAPAATLPSSAPSPPWPKVSSSMPSPRQGGQGFSDGLEPTEADDILVPQGQHGHQAAVEDDLGGPVAQHYLGTRHDTGLAIAPGDVDRKPLDLVDLPRPH